MFQESAHSRQFLAISTYSALRRALHTTHDIKHVNRSLGLLGRLPRSQGLLNHNQHVSQVEDFTTSSEQQNEVVVSSFFICLDVR